MAAAATRDGCARRRDLDGDHTATAADAGMVTVEAAIALAALVAVLAVALAGIVAMLDQLRCMDAARQAARLVARGDRERAPAAVHKIAPAGAQLSLSITGDRITVHVTAQPAGGFLPGITVDGTAFAVAEQGVTGAASQ